MILTSNRGFSEWGEVFGNPVVATALLDRLLHHAVVVQIEGSSYRLRQHAELMPEHLRSKASITPPTLNPPSRRRGRPPKNGHPPRQSERRSWGVLLRHFWGNSSGIDTSCTVGGYGGSTSVLVSWWSFAGLSDVEQSPACHDRPLSRNCQLSAHYPGLRPVGCSTLCPKTCPGADFVRDVLFCFTALHRRARCFPDVRRRGRVVAFKGNSVSHLTIRPRA